MNSTTPHEFAPQLRPDLQWSWHTEPPRWIARDPLTAGFFSFNDVERHATMLMNGRQSVGEILQQLGQRFPSSLLDRPWLHSLLARLQAHHLLSPGPTDDPRRWTQWRQRQRRRGRLQQLMSPLAIRVPLLDPSPLLRYMQAPAKLLFHPLMVALWLVSGGLLLFMVLREFLGSHFSLNFDLQAIHGDRWLILFLCYVVAKSLHELGHALACVRRNTACNEIGLLFLCFAPCLYCDTTDSWKLPSKWQRAGIAAAGMYVELILATLAAGLWLLTSEGTLHYVAASMMVVCSLGTLLVNSNPLLKYDGYYILSDLWGVPNLSEQSREATRALIRYALTAQPPQQSRLDANVWLLAAYAVLASVYRLFVLGVILWFSWQVLVPLGLGLVALAITAVLMLGMLLSQLRSWQGLYRELFTAGRVRVVRLLLCGT
ncbi:MAG: hypothetical protein KDA45_10625, partial [Planctomycetales bacterium]|nr:hypothetical protein [Planctomycetales bacterium]